MRRAAGLLLCLVALPALADERVAVPSFAFTDGSGEVRDQTAEHEAQLALFNETLRGALEEGGLDVVVPECGVDCSPGNTQFKAMAEASRAAMASRSGSGPLGVASSAARIAARCEGVVPQQPPMIVAPQSLASTA